MKTVVKTGLAMIALAGGALTALPALAQGAGGPPDPARAAQQAVNVRQSVMTLLSYSNGPTRGMAQGNAEYNAEIVQRTADRLSTLAPMIVEAFAADTREFDLETEALPVVWTAHDDFEAKAADFVAAVEALKAAADADDQAASIAAMAALGPTCGACHDVYRAD